MKKEDREKFEFNYDAFDVLIDPRYGRNEEGTSVIHPEGQKYEYDAAAGTEAAAKLNPAGYSLEKPVDYTATYNGSETSTHNGVTLEHGKEYSRAQFESLPNEKRHYTTVEVKEAGNVYVVKTPFQVGNTPYAVGTVISANTYSSLGQSDQANVTTLTFTSEQKNHTYYYCRDSYTINATIGKPVKAVKANGDVAQNTVKNIGDEVPVGFIISQTGEGIGSEYRYGYLSLMNQQTDFTIQGISPMETTTLYVTRDADDDNLSKEKIYTVIYQYDYEESDESGTHITPISERHVVRIHVLFENGIPTVEDIHEPEIVLPGTSITMRIPGVRSNGYEVIGGGWELFENQENAESHFNGKEYQPSVEPLYWYQDEFYLAYYAKTYNRGKTYSNVVPVHVANYHDLKEVMDDKENHLHIDYDRTRLKRDAKIYINDYSGSSQNGLQLFRDLYDLSLLDSPAVDENGLISSGTFIGHKPLNNSTATGTNIYDTHTYTKGVKGGKNLEFFFRTDITWPGSSSWSPIGDNEQCFEGTVHGDGHTIKGLDNSLFYNLCGNVYNLGVMGSFNTAGVVDKGNGYVESCWTSTTGTPDGSVYAVFGAPERTSAEKDLYGTVQLVNSYYQEGKTYKTGTPEHGVAKTKPAKAYYDGELAFDLNSFYLNKRFYKGSNLSTGDEHKYWQVNNDGSLPEAVSTGYYPTDGYTSYCDLGYVEARFADGDYRYAAGEIPESEDERYYEKKSKNPSGEDVVESSGFYPLYPDDYIFFGQKLTYGWAPEAHQDVPTAVVRDGGRLSQNDNANRVFRAPAYYRDKNMSVAYFNPTAYLVQKEKLSDEQIAYNEANPGSAITPRVANPGMTAIDFNGHKEGHATTAYKQGLVGDWFFSPLLDDDGLVSIKNCDQTQNLLVYAPATSGDGYTNAKTHGVLTSYFRDPIYNNYYDNTKGYRRVDEFIDIVKGHLVQSNLKATNDHLLADKEEFNCPIAYSFDENHLMWYQRRPDDSEYVNYGSKTGWQGVSLPFTAELVTTHQKGEITHFFGGSASSHNGTGTKKGHEYWLREFNSINVETTPSDKATAVMRYPDATGTEPKIATSTFLWDYYYKGVHNRLDKNADEYQKYYQNSREYNKYPLAGAGIPYILGLPGKSYYEFDLSGNFVAKNTATDIDKLAKQIITFASKTEESIKVSDDEIKDAKTTYTKKADGSSSKTFTFTFVPTYLKQTLTVNDDYAMNATGNAFEKVTGTVTSVPFRPYFTATSATSSSRRQAPSVIVFSGDFDDMNEQEPESLFKGTLEIYTRGRNIIATSHMSEPTRVNITNMSGITIANFVLQPDQTVETPVNLAGVYIINHKKLVVK